MVNKTRVCVVLCGGGAFKSVEKSHTNTYSRILYSKKRVYSDKQKSGGKRRNYIKILHPLQTAASSRNACLLYRPPNFFL